VGLRPLRPHPLRPTVARHPMIRPL
jgi:hypothetical protein